MVTPNPRTVQLTVIRWLLIPTITQDKLLTDGILPLGLGPVQPSSKWQQIILFLCVVKSIVFTVCASEEKKKKNRKDKSTPLCSLIFFGRKLIPTVFVDRRNKNTLKKSRLKS